MSESIKLAIIVYFIAAVISFGVSGAILLINWSIMAMTKMMNKK